MIQVSGLTKSVHQPGGGRRVILRDVSLAVPESCLYGLIGPGAAGKSVLLKMVTGLMRPDRGSVRIAHDVVTEVSELALQEIRKRIGMLFQNNALFDHMTVFDNIAFPLRRLYAPAEQEVRERVAERLACVSLPGFEQRMPAGLSGGQKKRVGVARATVTRAPIVLYDEPAAGLDPVTSQKIFDLLRSEQRASGATVVMVSSDLDRLLTVTDRVGMMYRGEMIFDGTTEEARACEEPRVRQFVHGLTEGPL
ncbi:MAG: ATP-binding cassette domain-containing protein [Gammaproteobacteria bacterium]